MVRIIYKDTSPEVGHLGHVVMPLLGANVFIIS